MRPGRRRFPRPLAVTLLVALVTAALARLAGGGDAFWVSVPGALIVSAVTLPRPGAAAASGAVVAVAALASNPGPRSIALALLIPAGSVAILVAVRERLQRERDEMRASAFSDPLTGVANRRSLLERVAYEIARHTRSGGSFCVVMLDLDGFKQLNDRFGHAAGDDLLRDVADALEGAVRHQDTVARLGGDEFCVLAPETDAAGTQKLAGKAMAAVGAVTAGVDALGASAGTALFPQDGTTIAALLDAADQRLLEVKRRRRRAHPRRRAA